MCPNLNQERNKLEYKLEQLKIPRHWSRMSLLHAPIFKTSQALYMFFSSIKDTFPFSPTVLLNFRLSLLPSGIKLN